MQKGLTVASAQNAEQSSQNAGQLFHLCLEWLIICALKERGEPLFLFILTTVRAGTVCLTWWWTVLCWGFESSGQVACLTSGHNCLCWT